MPEPVSWADGVGKRETIECADRHVQSSLLYRGCPAKLNRTLYLGQFCAKCHLVSFQIS